MRPLLRDLLRQPWRTTLTVLGITIGIFALVVFGALAEHFRSIVQDAKDYVRGTVRLVTKTNKAGENPGITADDLASVRSIAGVRAVVPQLTLLFDGYNLEDDPLLFLTPKPLVEGIPPELAERMRPGVRLVEGRWLRAGDDRHVMVVRWLARRRGWALGRKVDVRHVAHEVVGIFDAPDVAIVPAGIVPFEELRRGFENPNVQQAVRFFQAQRTARGAPGEGEADASARDAFLRQMQALAWQLVSAQGERYYPHEVVPETDSPGQARAIASEIRRRLPHVAVIEPEALAEQMEKAVAIFLAITAVVSLISSIVGGLLIVNTMAMAVVERRREIAIKVAIGASTGQVAFEFLFEAGLMGLVGSLLGVALGGLAIAILDPLLTSQLEVGESLFKATPRLILGCVAFGVGLGVAAGLLPALRAARAEPAPGLREL